MSAQDHFATLPAGRRNWTVAAIHAEVNRVRALHGHLAGRIQVGDNLIYLGNFLGRGDAVAETIEELLLFRRALLARPAAECDGIVYLRGSQEEMWHKLLQIQFAPNPGEVLKWMLEQGLGPTLAAYGATAEEARSAGNGGALVLTRWTNTLRAAMRAADGHTMLMSVLRRAAFTEDKSLLFVHAGIDVTRPLSEQHDSFWWGGGDFDNIETPYGGFRRVVRGFDHRHRGLEVKAATVTIDGACGFGGPLLAACFDADGELVDTIEA